MEDTVPPVLREVLRKPNTLAVNKINDSRSTGQNSSKRLALKNNKQRCSTMGTQDPSFCRLHVIRPLANMEMVSN